MVRCRWSTEALPLLTLEFTVIKAVSSDPLSHLSSHSPLSPASSTPLHTIPAADPLTVEFSLGVWCDPQFCFIQKANFLSS